MTVKRDTEGEDAKTVQRRLKELGYYKGRVDGKFGYQSVQALKAFQEDNGLKADGIAGKSTYDLLFSENVLAKGATPTPVPEATPAPGYEESGIPAEASYETLRRGTMSAEVAMMQQALIDLGYLTGEPDGNYGSATERAVRAFQKNNGMNDDGTAGSATLSRLYSPEALPASAAEVSYEASRPGDRGELVVEIQDCLVQEGYLDGITGVYDAETEAAVKAFQKANGLTADGVAGEKTLQILFGY
jgi:peptidoglycan hydrolase-like protein with peptidoglycan-binding domain